MFSVDKFLIVSGDQKNIYVRSDDGKQSYTILAFNIGASFVSGNLLKIKQVGTDQIVTIPFRNIVEANLALKKLQDQLDILRNNTPFILEKGMQNYVDDQIVNVNSDLSGIYSTISVFNQNFDNIFATLSVIDSELSGIYNTLSVFDSNFDNIYATLSIYDTNFDNIFATLSVIDSDVTNIYATISDIQQTLLTNDYSAGIISGATAWTNNGNGSITLPNLTVSIFDNPNWIAPSRLFNVIGGTTGVDFATLNNNDTNYIYIDYNGGNPIYVVDTLDGAINDSNVLRYLTVYRDNNFLHILEYGNEGAGLSNKINNRIIQTERIIRESGVELGLSASGVVTISEGIVWNGTNRININPVDSISDIFFSNYHVSGTWSFTTSNTSLNNLYFDNGTDLVVASSSKYLTNWYYRGLEVDDHVYEVVSTNQYDSVSEAQLSKVPALPELITSHAFLVGRIIVGVGTQSGLVESAFSTYFQPSNVTSHSDLTNLQGGGPGEYYHLTYNQRANLAFVNVDNSFSTNQTVGGYVSASTYYGDGSNLSGIFDTKVNNLEYNNPILTLSQNDGSSYSVTISTVDSYVTGLSFSGGVLSLGQTGIGQAFTASIPDTFVTGLTYSGSTLTLSQNQGRPPLSVTISTVDSYVTSLGFSNSVLSLGQTGVGQTFTASIPDTFVTGLTYSGSNLTLEQNDGSTFSVTISTSDIFTTGATLSSSELIFDRNDGLTYSVNLSTLSTTASGTNGLIQYNKNGSFASDPNLYFDEALKFLYLGGIVIQTGTAPSGNITDAFQLYSADRAAGQAGAVIRSENGTQHIFADRVGVRTITPNAALEVIGLGIDNQSFSLQVHNSTGTNNALVVRDDGFIGIGSASPTARLFINTQGALSTDLAFRIRNSSNNADLFSVQGNAITNFGGGVGGGGSQLQIICGSGWGTNCFLQFAGSRSISNLAGGSVELGFYINHNTNSRNVGVMIGNSSGTQIFIDGGSNIRIGQGFSNMNQPDANATRTLLIANGVAPTTSPADIIQMYSADIVAGNAAPHFRTENGSIIKLYQQPAVTTSQGIADALTNAGLLASGSVVAGVDELQVALTAQVFS